MITPSTIITPLKHLGVTAAAVFHPFADAGHGTAAETGASDNRGVGFAAVKHAGCLQAAAHLGDFFFGHYVAQEILHGPRIINGCQGLGELPGGLSSPNRVSTSYHALYFIKVKYPCQASFLLCGMEAC